VKGGLTSTRGGNIQTQPQIIVGNIVTANTVVPVMPQAVAMHVFLCAGGSAGGGITASANSYGGGGPQGGFGIYRIDITGIIKDFGASTIPYIVFNIGAGGVGANGGAGGIGGNTTVTIGTSNIIYTAYGAVGGGKLGSGGAGGATTGGGMYSTGATAFGQTTDLNGNIPSSYARAINMFGIFSGNYAQNYLLYGAPSGIASSSFSGGSSGHAAAGGAGNSGTVYNNTLIIFPAWLTAVGMAVTTPTASGSTRGGPGGPSFNGNNGVGPVQISTSQNGTAATGYGGGGGGATTGSVTNTAQFGGNGAPGVIAYAWELYA
jgi:hypothetical protein